MSGCQLHVCISLLVSFYLCRSFLATSISPNMRKAETAFVQKKTFKSDWQVFYVNITTNQLCLKEKLTENDSFGNEDKCAELLLFYKTDQYNWSVYKTIKQGTSLLTICTPLVKYNLIMYLVVSSYMYQSILCFMKILVIFFHLCHQPLTIIQLCSSVKLFLFCFKNCFR